MITTKIPITNQLKINNLHKWLCVTKSVELRQKDSFLKAWLNSNLEWNLNDILNIVLCALDWLSIIFGSFIQCNINMKYIKTKSIN